MNYLRQFCTLRQIFLILMITMATLSGENYLAIAMMKKHFNSFFSSLSKYFFERVDEEIAKLQELEPWYPIEVSTKRRQYIILLKNCIIKIRDYEIFENMSDTTYLLYLQNSN